MIIGVSGKISSGKDTVGKIIQGLIIGEEEFEDGIMGFLDTYDDYLSYQPKEWEVKKFADKLKDMVCMLIGCTRQQLEDINFKNRELGMEWWYYKIPQARPHRDRLVNYSDNDLNDVDKEICNSRYLIKTTPRLLLQLLGTECGRDILHPNIWVNALMGDYVHKYYNTHGQEVARGNYEDFVNNSDSERPRKKLPNWVITDMRFPNELEAVKRRAGITIRVERDYVLRGADEDPKKQHESETALDKAEFDYTIYNTGTVEELIINVEQVLVHAQIITNDTKS